MSINAIEVKDVTKVYRLYEKLLTFKLKKLVNYNLKFLRFKEV